jgi:YfiH family protein
LLRADLLSAVSGLAHGFTADRRLSFSADPDDPALGELARRAEVTPGRFALARQVHGRDVLRVDAPGFAGDADALITGAEDVYLTIRTADCVPILLLGADRELAAVHAGWRGTAADIVAATVAAMHAPPRAAVIGPCISAAAYEVGEEVVEGIAASGVPVEVFVRRDMGDRPHVDLRAAVAWQLHRCGVTAVSILPQCTVGDPRLHSYRRDRGESGRMVSFIGWRP